MKIIIPPHDTKATPVLHFDQIKNEARAMIALIRQNDFEGIWPSAYALAHSQVHYNPQSFFVVNKTSQDVKQLFKKEIIINPVILEQSDLKTLEEGCMSIQTKKTFRRKRYNRIKVRYYYPGFLGKLKEVVEECVGLKAQIFQHEIDHFNGKY